MPLSSPDYKILETIYESNSSQVFRVQRRSDFQSVILKTPRSPYPTTKEINHYRREYELTKSLQLPGIVEVLGFETFDRSVGIVLQDFGAIQIREWTPHKRIEEFLQVGIDIAAALATIHDQNIIHKDINSSNIIINPQSKEVKIIDFGISTKLNRENPRLENPHILEGTLAYISPEQTGRMNRYLDYRSDFYSLGVTFYELLSGTLPFISDDPLELVYCHLARIPPPLPETVPPVVRQIVMKLLAKTAEDRYQSAWGLKADLEECYRQWQTMGIVLDFPLGQEDHQSQLQIPQKLYGREKEVKILLTTFDRVCQSRRSELLLVTGRGGLGKTRLIQEIYKPITAKQGYFLAGKSDQMERSVPYGVLISALEGFVKQILEEKEEVIKAWREQLLAAVGNNGRIIQELLPSLADLWGEQPPLVPVGAEEQQNRFHSVMQNFMVALGQTDQPLVIFLDDLQWVDYPTLDLLGRLLSDDRQSLLLVIGAYRDNEVDSNHPLPFALQQWQLQPSYIELAPLTQETVTEFLADSLHTDPHLLAPLAELIYRQTGGNPFFVVELWQQLYQEGWLRFDRGRRAWVWDMGAIEGLGISADVVELLLKKLRELPELTQTLLGLAACVGNTFSLEILVSLTHLPPDRVFDALLPSLNLGLLGAVGTLDQELRVEVLTFSHDRIQQASLELLDPKDLPNIHYQLGQYYRSRGNLFLVVDHLNQAQDLVSDRAELAELNYQALCKAKASVAYAAAINYGETTLRIIPENAPLVRRVYLELGTLYFLQGQYDRTEALLPQLFQLCSEKNDRVAVWILQIQLYRNTDCLDRVIDVGITALKHLGVRMPRHAKVYHLIGAILWLQWITWAQRVEDWLQLQPISQRNRELALEIVSLISSSVFEKEPLLIPLIPQTTIGISLRYGRGIGSDTGFAGLALIYCGLLQRMVMGNRLAKVALELAYRQPSANLPRVIFIVNAFVHHWQYPLRETLPQFQHCVNKGQELGNLEMVSAGASFYCNHLFFSGENLDRVYSECDLYSRLVLRVSPKRGTKSIDIIRATIHRLQNKQDLDLGEIELNTTPFEQYQKDLCILILSYLFNNLPEAVSLAQGLEGKATAVFGMFSLVVSNFYIGLVYLAEIEKLPPSQAAKRQKKINKILKQMAKWAQFSPHNHLHRYELLKAEQAKLNQQTLLAIESYDRSISHAKMSGFLPEEGLGNELAGRFHLQAGRTRLACSYLEEACYCYARWGASQKVAALEQEFAPLQLNFNRPSPTLRAKTLTTGSSSSKVLDIDSVIRASQAIASEMVLDRLLTNLMDILVKNAGAERGFLLLPPLDRWRQTDELQIFASFDQGTIQIKPQLTLSDWIPPRLLAFIRLNQASVVLDDAQNEGDFQTEEIIKQRQVQSLLCAPLLDKGTLVGIIYLENNLTKGAFPPDRVEILQLLSSQAAIAIENSYLYTNLEKTLKENLRMRSELDIAQTIQQMFLPKEKDFLQVKDLDIAGVMLPADEVGGDYYDVLPLEDKTIFAIGDVTGHGLTSGVFAIVAQSALRTLPSPLNLSPINHVLYESAQRLQTDLNMTLLVLTYSRGRFTMTGQHEDVLILRSGGRIEMIDTSNLGFPLGLVPDITPFLNTKTIELLPQETIVLYTDGIAEAENKDRQFYGTDRLCRVLEKHHNLDAKGIRDALLEDVKSFIGNGQILDDITLLVIQRKT